MVTIAKIVLVTIIQYIAIIALAFAGMLITMFVQAGINRAKQVWAYHQTRKTLLCAMNDSVIIIVGKVTK